jgi:hypothetical protein
MKMRMIGKQVEISASQIALHIDAASAAPMGFVAFERYEIRPDSLVFQRHES